MHEWPVPREIPYKERRKQDETHVEKKSSFPFGYEVGVLAAADGSDGG